MVNVFEAKTRKQMKKFARFPILLYKGNPYYVPSFIVDDVNMKNKNKNFSAEALGLEDPLEKEMATHSSILVWKISWTEVPTMLPNCGVREHF